MNRKITQKQKDEKRAQALRENLKKRKTFDQGDICVVETKLHTKHLGCSKLVGNSYLLHLRNSYLLNLLNLWGAGKPPHLHAHLS